jgi:hypothetical protein
LVELVERVRQGTVSEEELPPIARPVAAGLGPDAAYPLAKWAIVEALLHALTADDSTEGVIGAVAEWLASAPLERLRLWSHTVLLEQELAALARFFDFQPEARLRLGSRLAAKRPASVDALQRHDFLVRPGN